LYQTRWAARRALIPGAAGDGPFPASKNSGSNSRNARSLEDVQGRVEHFVIFDPDVAANLSSPCAVLFFGCPDVGRPQMFDRYPRVCVQLMTNPDQNGDSLHMGQRGRRGNIKNRATSTATIVAKASIC